MLIGGENAPTLPLPTTEFTEAIRDTQGNIVNIITWVSSARTIKIKEDVLQRDVEGRVIQFDQICFVQGVEIVRVQNMFTYNMDRVVTRSAVRIFA